MAVDFFEATQETVHSLNKTERQLFEYVVKNMDTVKHMSIQKLAATCFLSTTTIFRFAQKLGFSGYTDFINSLLVTSHSQSVAEIPDVVTSPGYGEEYLDNLMESVRVMSPKRLGEVVEVLGKKPHIYILTDEHTHTIGQYCEKLFLGLGFRAYFPEVSYHLQHLTNYIRDADMIIALSYSGQDPVLLDFIERVFLQVKPYLLSITRAENNVLQSLSDANFYVFSDEILMNGLDLTSSVPMLMVLERLLYAYLSEHNDT